MTHKANSLSLTKWICKHHVVFAPEHGRRIIHEQHGRDLGEMPGMLCHRKGVETMEGHLIPNHARMPTGTPPFFSERPGDAALAWRGRGPATRLGTARPPARTHRASAPFVVSEQLAYAASSGTSSLPVCSAGLEEARMHGVRAVADHLDVLVAELASDLGGAHVGILSPLAATASARGLCSSIVMTLPSTSRSARFLHVCTSFIAKL